MRSKKMFMVFVAVLLMAVLVLSSCAPKQPGQEPQAGDEGNKRDPVSVGIATATIGGAFYPVGQAIASVVEKHVDYVTMTPEVTNGAVENPRLIHSGDSEFAITNSDVGFFAYNGMAPYEEKLDIVALGNLHPSVFHIIVLDDSPIKDIPDLKGKKVAIGPAGGGTLNLLPVVFEQYGMTLDDINPSYLPYTDGFQQLADGNVDAALALGGYPAAAVLEVSTTQKVRFLSVGDEQFKGIMDEYPYYSKTVVPKDVYGLDEDAAAVGIKNLLICRSGMDEQLVYDVAKAIYDHLDELAAINKNAAQIEDETAGETAIPMHPGAEKYFKERK